MTIDEQIQYIANYYGYESQSRQCIEEMAELTQAINKLWRAKHIDTYKPGAEEVIIKAEENFIEEMADVFIMICQLQELQGIDDNKFIKVIEKKLDREVKRIKQAS